MATYDPLEKRFYSIGQVAEIVGIAPSTLRFYERETGLFNLKRTDTGRRLYRPKDIETIKMLLYLIQDKGMHLHAAADQIRQNPDGILRHAQAIERLKQVRDRIQQTIDSLHSMR